MASAKRYFGGEGVNIPSAQSPQVPGGGGIVQDMGDPSFSSDGLLLLNIIKRGVFVVMSRRNGEFYFVKLQTRRHGIRASLSLHGEFTHAQGPSDYRFSTWAGAPRIVPTQSQFPRLVFIGRPNVDRWYLYFK